MGMDSIIVLSLITLYVCTHLCLNVYIYVQVYMNMCLAFEGQRLM